MKTIRRIASWLRWTFGPTAIEYRGFIPTKKQLVDAIGTIMGDEEI